VGTELITERAISMDRPLTEEQVFDLLHRYFICPYCGNISRLFAVNEFYGEDGSIVGREYYLSCYDVEDLPPEEARNGTLPFRKIHHRVSDLGELEDIKITRTNPNVEVFLHAYNYDAEGHLTQRLIQRSDSFLPNFLGMLYSQLECPYNGSATSGSGPNTSNSNNVFIGDYTGSTYVPCQEDFAINAGSGDASYGIQVGTGTTANSTSTYALAALIANGTASGQLSYGSNSTAWSTGSTSATVARLFSNSSGASITISEVGLVCKFLNGSDATDTFLMIRDVLSSSVSVATSGSTTLQYTISITVS